MFGFFFWMMDNARLGFHDGGSFQAFLGLRSCRGFDPLGRRFEASEAGVNCTIASFNNRTKTYVCTVVSRQL